MLVKIVRLPFFLIVGKLCLKFSLIFIVSGKKLLSINTSGTVWEISPDGKTLIQPLTSVKGLGDAAIAQVLDNRPFETIEDFLFNDDIVYSKLNKVLNDQLNKEELIKNYSNILVAMSPVIPHFANECLEMLKFGNKEEKIKWPSINKKILISDKINFVVQVNGKTRGILNIKIGFNQNEVLNMINDNDKINNYIKDKTIKNIIFIADKLINIII